MGERKERIVPQITEEQRAYIEEFVPRGEAALSDLSTTKGSLSPNQETSLHNLIGHKIGSNERIVLNSIRLESVKGKSDQIKSDKIPKGSTVSLILKEYDNVIHSERNQYNLSNDLSHGDDAFIYESDIDTSVLRQIASLKCVFSDIVENAPRKKGFITPSYEGDGNSKAGSHFDYNRVKNFNYKKDSVIPYLVYQHRTDTSFDGCDMNFYRSNDTDKVSLDPSMLVKLSTMYMDEKFSKFFPIDTESTVIKISTQDENIESIVLEFKYIIYKIGNPETEHHKRCHASLDLLKI